MLGSSQHQTGEPSPETGSSAADLPVPPWPGKLAWTGEKGGTPALVNVTSRGTEAPQTALWRNGKRAGLSIRYLLRFVGSILARATVFSCYITDATRVRCDDVRPSVRLAPVSSIPSPIISPHTSRA